MKKKNTKLNLVNVAKLINGRDWDKIDEKEKDEIVEKILAQISPNSQK